MRTTVTAAFVALALAGAGCGSKDKSGTGAASNTTPTVTAPIQTQTQPQTTAGGCEAVEAPQPRQPGHGKKPKAPLASGRKWALRVDTNCGSFTIALDLRTAPNASASLVALARRHFFDSTVFHRIAPGFVIQGGDPTASGGGGPGYKTVDKPPRNAGYVHGVVAMAKTGTEKPGTGGSQFFVVTGPDAQLPPDYAVLGKVTKGLDVVDKIGRLGDQSEQPTEPVVIKKMTVTTG